MSPTLNAGIAVIGIDIGKNSFHVVGLDRRGAIVLRQKWSRGQVASRLATMPRCLIGMEACVGAHHLSRKLISLGHDAGLMPAKFCVVRRSDLETKKLFAHPSIHLPEHQSSDAALTLGLQPLENARTLASRTGGLNASAPLPASRTLCSAAALLRRADIMQVQGRSDESKVRKRLRKIADLPLRLRIVFFREQADIVANR